MNNTIEAKIVREARASARKTARKGQISYQQALDDIARGSGHAHWSAFVAAHPSTAVGNDGKPTIQKRRRADTAALVRSFVSGELGQRNQAALERDAVKESRVGSAFGVPGRLLDTAFWVWALGVWVTPSSSSPPGSWSMSTAEIVPPLAAVTVVTVLYGLARIVGDHPSMAHRRAQLLLLCNTLAAAFFVLGVIGAAMAYKYPGTLIPFRYLPSFTNIEVIGIGVLGTVFFRVVGRNGVRAMAAAAPGTVQPRTIPDTEIPRWLSGTLEGAIAICVLASIAGVLLLLADGLTLLFGGDLKVTGIEVALLLGPIAVGWAAYAVLSHFRRLGYLDQGPQNTYA